jgi:ADP-heptose:LPS heptosyltransferase
MVWSSGNPGSGHNGLEKQELYSTNKLKKILIIRLSSIGDIIWTTPVIRCLKNQLKDVELHYCTKIQYRSLVESNPNIDRIHYLENNLVGLIHSLKKEKFDHVVDLHKNIRTLIIKLQLGVRSTSYDKLWIQRFLLTRFQINFMPNCHVVDRYMEAVQSLGVTNDHRGLDYVIPSPEEIDVQSLPDSFRTGYVAYVIGGTGMTKILPFEKMVELCDRINRPVVLIGGREDYESGEKLRKFFERTALSAPFEAGLNELNKKTIIYNGCGKYSIGQSASLVKQADYVFGHDTGLTHIAAAFKKSIYSIWGGTVPNNFYPYGTRFFVLENKDLDCRPCSKSGRPECPRGHFKCMKENPLNFSLPENHD